MATRTELFCRWAAARPYSKPSDAASDTCQTMPWLATRRMPLRLERRPVVLNRRAGRAYGGRTSSHGRSLPVVHERNSEVICSRSFLSDATSAVTHLLNGERDRREISCSGAHPGKRDGSLRPGVLCLSMVLNQEPRSLIHLMCIYQVSRFANLSTVVYRSVGETGSVNSMHLCVVKIHLTHYYVMQMRCNYAVLFMFSFCSAVNQDSSGKIWN